MGFSRFFYEVFNFRSIYIQKILEGINALGSNVPKPKIGNEKTLGQKIRVRKIRL